MIEELQNAIREQQEKGNTLKRGASIPPQNHSNEVDVEPEKNNKGKEREHSPTPIYEDPSVAAAAEEHATKLRGLQQRLKEIRLVLHRIKFLQGDVYHVLGGQHAESESQAYEIADQIRKDILKGMSFPRQRNVGSSANCL